MTPEERVATKTPKAPKRCPHNFDVCLLCGWGIPARPVRAAGKGKR